MLLNVHSYFSLRYGTLAPETLADRLAAAGYRAAALTDINNTSCAYTFVRTCRAAGIHPVLGIEFRQDHRLLYIGLARNREGWRQLTALLSRHSMAGLPLPELAPELPDTYIIYRDPPKPLHAFAENEYLGIRPEQLNTLYGSELLGCRDRLVALSPVTFADERGFRLHKLLRCMDLNIVGGKLQPADCASPAEKLRNAVDLEAEFALYPDILERSTRLLESCTAELEPSAQHNRRHFTASREKDRALLRRLALDGYRERYGCADTDALERVERELEIIDRMEFNAYFLITWDIVRHARERGFWHVGRGSGANSIVAFCLHITDVDPQDLDLYFERFINQHRSSPPDFDIDFSWDEREQIYAYIFDQYGIDHTALLATYSTFRGSSTIRELGRVFGLPKEDIDCIVEEPEATDRHHPYARQLFFYARELEGFPNYLSIHAGGILITEEPIHYFTAQQQMQKGYPITHFDMYGAEDLLLHKYDILSQRGLGHIRESVRLIRDNRGCDIDIHAVHRIKEDPGVRRQLRSGLCTGCFYIESPAMRGLLTRLGCDNYLHLVAASSIIRPGVAQSGMMREYIRRYHDPGSVRYLHPVFEQHLKETFGVMVYQEDVIKIVHHFAGLGLDDADILRRIMNGKRRDSDQYRDLRARYFHNCRERGYSDVLASEVWRQIESFSGFSFCKAHSASFAVESMQSLYLKTYFPLEFMVAVINNFGGFYDTELYVHEARMQGGRIHAPCVNNSGYLTGISVSDIFLGFVHMRSLQEGLGREIVSERDRRGPYRSLADFVRRVGAGQEQLMLLVRIGAFRFTGMSKCALMWEKNRLSDPVKARRRQPALFEEPPSEYSLPKLDEGRYDQSFDELELLGFPLCPPFDLLASRPPYHFTPASGLAAAEGREVYMLGYFVTSKPVRTSQGGRMAFGTWLDEEGRFFDTTHFPPELRRYPFRGKGCYLIQGRVTVEFGFATVDLIRMEKLPFVKDERY